jgi:glutamine---fructose-6-phosphate transaminase (isomerizing)
MPVEVQVSSEFRYNDPIIDDETLVVAITQSGETADTLAGVREARERGAKVIAITNVVGSRVTRESDGASTRTPVPRSASRRPRRSRPR